MNFLSGESKDVTGIVRVIYLVDLIQPAAYIFSKAWSIIFRSENNDAIPHASEHHSYVVLTAVVICFYIIQMAMALKLLSALQLMDTDTLMAMRNAKIWQSWSIVVLVFLVASFFASILSAGSKLAVAFSTLYGTLEIFWRLFGIYNVGSFIDELLSRMSSVSFIPTTKYFNIRFPRRKSLEDNI